MSPISPAEQLLQQCLLLPLFLDAVMAVAVMRSSRGPANRALAALLSVLCLVTAAALVSEHPWGRMASSAIGMLVGPALFWFLRAYSGGKMNAGAGGPVALVVALPAAISLACAVAMDLPPTHPAYLLMAAAYFGAAGVLFARIFGARTLFGREPELIGAAMVVLFMSGPVYDFAYSGIVPLTLYPYLAAISAGLLTLLVVKYKAFSFRPMAESSLKGDRGFYHAPGVYLARTDRSGQARSVFADAARHGIPGLAVTHAHPVAFRRQTGIRNIPVIWLANSDYEKSLPPGQPDILLHALKDYMGQSAMSVVLLEDLDYLVTNAGLFPTFDFLGALSEAANRAKAVVILTSELLTPDERRDLAGLGIKALR